ncbi:Isochorismate synthase DhbC [compost metagenome]
MIEDIRSLLSPVCAELDVPDKPSLINTAALWHLSTRIEGRLADPETNALQLACLLHPTPAVCGFPTERAHRLIRFVEPFERGLFTGMVGWTDSEGNGEWVVTIRCGTVQRETVRLFAGAGIVEASEPESEWAEVQTKLKTMLNACGLSA